jgi:hypothetical protein
MRVRVGGERGVLLHCEPRSGAARYWKVRLQTGQWVSPARLVVDGQGDELVPACGRCGLPFLRRPQSGELLCIYCDVELFGTERDHALDVAADAHLSPRDWR